MSNWREIAEWDWVWVEGDAHKDDEVLHAVRSLTNDATVDADWYGDGTTECGITATLTIPGMISRMSATRCPACCDATGMPHGTQSPKNVDACRPIAEARITKLPQKDGPAACPHCKRPLRTHD
jgi:hypothetical protein